MMSSHVVIGVDVGGTFTDILALDEHSEEVRVFKIPSTREDQSIGFLEGILEVSENVKDVGTIIHGTTVATNALLERKGAKTGIITTSGFRDVLEMRRRDRPTTWGLWGQFTPVVQRVDRLEVEERTLADGTVRVAVDLMEVERAAKTLLRTVVKPYAYFSLMDMPIQKTRKRLPKVFARFGQMSTLALQQKFFLKSENLKDVQRLL
tara:strand:+ start:120 stop:740 length:621 start_codon:yes stop_codon:yes gene_type:complete